MINPRWDSGRTGPRKGFERNMSMGSALFRLSILEYGKSHSYKCNFSKETSTQPQSRLGQGKRLF